MLILLALFSVLGFCSAGRASYLGGDLEQYAEISKKAQIVPRPNRPPVTAKQLEEYKTYQSKFSDIAKAYSEGYKAAIQAVQARAVIAQKRLRNSKRSKIPAAPGGFKDSVPNLVTVPGTEKSSIPRPEDLLKVAKRSLEENGFHRGIPSVLMSEEKRAEISKLNAAALHRNAFLDNTGGLSYGGMGGVLSHQSWRMTKKHRRSIDDNEEVPEFIVRHRRSRMPYLGQNLDRLGVVRVKPNWEDQPAKKENVPKPDVVEPQPSPIKATVFGKQINPFVRNNIPSTGSSNPWNTWQQRAQIPANPYPLQGQMAYPSPYGAYAYPSVFSNNQVENSNSEKEHVRTKKSIEYVKGY